MQKLLPLLKIILFIQKFVDAALALCPFSLCPLPFALCSLFFARSFKLNKVPVASFFLYNIKKRRLMF
jgi:hypothetical protein